MSKDILAIVQDMGQWKGDVYRLAVAVAAAQREADARKAEAAGQQELAEAIRQGD